jgi:protein SCO1/2
MIVLAALGPARARDDVPTQPAATETTTTQPTTTRRIAPIPAASGLVDQRGRALTEAAFAGRVRLVYFGYTHCPDACPTALATVTQALDRLPPEIARGVVPVLVAADPARDDARVLGAYLEAFHPSFVAVTGPVPAIDDLAWSYGALILRHPDEGAAGYAVDHSTDLHLVGPAGDLIARLPHAIGAEALAERLRASVAAAPAPRETRP